MSAEAIRVAAGAARAPALRPPAPLGAARLLAQPRGRVLHLPVPAAAVRPARLGLLGEDLRRAGGLGGPRRARSATGARTPPSPGSRSSSSLRRESGILKRLRSTPLPPATYVAALLASTLVVFALQTVALFLLGRALYGTPFPPDIGSFVVTIVIGAAVFAALGTATASVIRSAEGSSAVVNFILLPMAFLSGAFGPTQHYPAVPPRDRRRPAAHVLHQAGQRRLPPWARRLDAAGGARHPAAWGLAGLVFTIFKFRWEPQAR